ncbi:hypothetical protein BDV18DRAFT_158991 [Aspergillus unguis]
MAFKESKVGKHTTKTSKTKAPSPQQKRRKAVPRQDSPHTNDPRNRTSYHPQQAGWSWDNLPEILYQLNPLEKDNHHGPVGTLPYPIHKHYLRDLPVLPDNISSAVEEFRLEAWLRLDSRICLEDIIQRMHPDFAIQKNALQQRGVRFRQAFHLKAWRSGNKRSQQLSADIDRALAAKGLDAARNSTRGLTPGLIDPKLGEVGGRIDFPEGWKSRKIGGQSKFSISLNQPAPQPWKQEVVSPSSPSHVSETVYQESEFDVPDVPETLSDVSSDASSEVFSEDLDFLPEAEDFDIPQTPEPIKHEPQVINFTHEYIPYDESLGHPDGALPVICGLIPDQDLPKTISMSELEVVFNAGQPTPEIIPDNEDLPLWNNPDRLQHLAGRNPSRAIFHRGFCKSSSFCFDHPTQHAEPLSYSLPDLGDAPCNPQTPSTGNFPLNSPVQLNLFPEDEQKNIFDDMLNNYYKGERELSEMPYYHPGAIF